MSRLHALHFLNLCVLNKVHEELNVIIFKKDQVTFGLYYAGTRLVFNFFGDDHEQFKKWHLTLIWRGRSFSSIFPISWARHWIADVRNIVDL